MSGESVHLLVETAARDRRGSVGIVFAAAVLPLLAAVGAAMDYSRASAARTRLASAADSAALAVMRAGEQDEGRRSALGRNAFHAAIGDELGLEQLDVRVTMIDGGVRVEGRALVRNRVMGVVGFDRSPIAVLAEAKASSPQPTEIALVLDTTGSMRNDMPALRDGARAFIDVVFAAGGDTKFAVVPYVAAVNPGRSNLAASHLDVEARSRWHGHIFRDAEIGFMRECRVPGGTPPPAAETISSDGSSESGAGSTPREKPRPDAGDTLPRGNDRVDSRTGVGGLAAIARELFGIASARAQVTPATDTPTVGEQVSPGPPYRVDGGHAILPPGFVWRFPCNIHNPPRISHFDLFNRVAGARWKGCVEARPEPYDVTDAAPVTGDPDTLFVPYFWADEHGDRGTTRVANSYLNDGVLPPGWGRTGNARAFVNLFKYTPSAAALIDETPPDTKGPNASCPDEMLPLTADRLRVSDRIATLNHWFGGGTITSEGVMWGWRALSPSAPFTEGAAYGTVRKVMVVMSDGMNSLVVNADGTPKSEYTAYGWLFKDREGRFGSRRFIDAEIYLNERMRLACANAKAAGITIMTVLYREDDETAQRAMRECASEPRLALKASDPAELRRAFLSLAQELVGIRLTR